MSQTQLRPCTATDIDHITAIYQHAVLHGTATYELVAPDQQEMRRRYEELTQLGYPYIVAVLNDIIIGYAYAAPFRERPAYRFCVEDSIYIDPSHQGKGAGRLLLQELIKECRLLGFHQLVAVIGDGTDKNNSVKLHKALGFENAGTLKGSGYKFGRWLDTVFMQLELNDGVKNPPESTSLPEKLFQKK